VGRKLGFASSCPAFYRILVLNIDDSNILWSPFLLSYALQIETLLTHITGRGHDLRLVIKPSLVSFVEVYQKLWPLVLVASWLYFDFHLAQTKKCFPQSTYY
jgi:hypothetical protein